MIYNFKNDTLFFNRSLHASFSEAAKGDLWEIGLPDICR